MLHWYSAEEVYGSYFAWAPAFVAMVIALVMVVERLQQRRTAVEAAAEALWQQRHTERLSWEAATQYETLPLSTS